MISKVTASPSFQGKVTIGQTGYERKQIAKTIMDSPKDARRELLNSMVNLRTFFEKTTPDDANFSIGLYDDLKYYKRGSEAQNIFITATRKGEELPFKTSIAEVDRRDYDLSHTTIVENIKNAFAELQVAVSSKYEPLIKEPETLEDVLDTIA